METWQNIVLIVAGLILIVLLKRIIKKFTRKEFWIFQDTQTNPDGNKIISYWVGNKQFDSYEKARQYAERIKNAK